jgi:hypothetical protein
MKPQVLAQMIIHLLPRLVEQRQDKDSDSHSIACRTVCGFTPAATHGGVIVTCVNDDLLFTTKFSNSTPGYTVIETNHPAIPSRELRGAISAGKIFDSGHSSEGVWVRGSNGITVVPVYRVGEKAICTDVILRAWDAAGFLRFIFKYFSCIPPFFVNPPDGKIRISSLTLFSFSFFPKITLSISLPL